MLQTKSARVKRFSCKPKQGNLIFETHDIQREVKKSKLPLLRRIDGLKSFKIVLCSSNQTFQFLVDTKKDREPQCRLGRGSAPQGVMDVFSQHGDAGIITESSANYAGFAHIERI